METITFSPAAFVAYTLIICVLNAFLSELTIRGWRKLRPLPVPPKTAEETTLAELLAIFEQDMQNGTEALDRWLNINGRITLEKLDEWEKIKTTAALARKQWGAMTGVVKMLNLRYRIEEQLGKAPTGKVEKPSGGRMKPTNIKPPPPPTGNPGLF